MYRGRPQRIAMALCLLCAASFVAGAEGAPRGSDVALTIYSAPSKAGLQPQGQRPMVQMATQQRFRPGWGGQGTGTGFGVVKEIRTINVKDGITRYGFSDVAARLDATTVRFRSLSDPRRTTVLEQNFEYDLVNAARLMEKYIGRKIAFAPPPDKDWKPIEGTLLSTWGGQIIRVGETVHINPPGHVVLPALPEGLITRPTLEWLIRSPRAGPQRVEVAYQTEGLSWEAAYTALLGGDEKTLDLSAWVTIANQSGATYTDARLKLVAGDVHRVEPPIAAQQADFRRAYENETQAQEQRGFEEKGFFEYHLYTLRRQATIADNSIKQIEMFEPVEGVPVEKVYVYYGFPQDPQWRGDRPNWNRSLGTHCNTDVDIYLKFTNEEDGGLGMPLPAGRVRLYKRDPADGQMEFIGEDWIDHTPRDEEVLLRLGSAFDLVGERKQTDFKVDQGRRWLRESFEITVRNHKDEDVRVIVKENLYRWMNWEIEQSTLPFEKQDARTIHFPVRVERNSDAVVTYTVLYTW